MHTWFFITAIVTLTLSLGLCLATLVIPKIEYWPPPSRSSWQYRVFWWSYRIILVCLIGLAVVEWTSTRFSFDPSSSTILGCVLFVVGIGLATYFTIKLGWRNAHGAKDGLVTSGIFRYSRNPIYVVSVVGFAGFAFMVGSWQVYTLSALLIAFYLIIPFLEEPWLEIQYGESYREYRSKTRRFI